ncbi:MAG: phosphonate ABC transporter, permease protein PhnE [Proteobacteria bacterium]|nr:phosphonate ABC transporter, permease protein PhnE [Pseudomonadota bacterium]
MHAKPSSDAAVIDDVEVTTLLEDGERAVAGDALAPPRTLRWRKWKRDLVWAGLIGLVVWSIDRLDIPLDRLPGILGRMGETLMTRYFPPDIARITQRDYLGSVFETLEMAYLATVVGIVLAIPLAWFASANMSPSKRILYPLSRLAIMACRSVHEMIWTILAVSILGFGMLPGVLALTLFCVGFAGKLFAEAIEAIDQGPVDAMRATGANPLQTFVYAVLPQVRVAWTGTSIYTWDVVFRAATVVGFFGAGGMGWYLRESMQRIASQEVAAIILSIIIVVLIAELFSSWLRGRIARAIA